VEDEDKLRNGLQRFVDWAELGFEISGCFADGQAALEFLSANRVDAVLTDIRMTEISGLDLAEQIFHRWPGTKVVLMSGYKDFEYAQRAIQFNIVYYLTKPTDIDEIERVFCQIKHRLDEEHAKEQQFQREKERFREAVPFLREYFFKDLLAGGDAAAGDWQKQMELLDLPANAAQLCCCLLAIRLEAEETFSSNGQEPRRTQMFDALGDVLQQQSADIAYIPVTRHASSDSMKVLAVSLTVRELADFLEAVRAHFEEARLHICSFFRQNNVMEIEASAENIEKLSRSVSGIKAEHAPADVSSAAVIIRKAKDYIMHHYHEDISLEDVADRVFLNHFYFSRFFKEHTGENFTDFLIKVRISQAISMMRENKYKIYEISSMIGYKSDKYFARLFKQATGYSPRDYIRFVLQRDDDE
jgi:YesN/AraC family two-component response regulator